MTEMDILIYFHEIFSYIQAEICQFCLLTMVKALFISKDNTILECFDSTIIFKISLKFSSENNTKWTVSVHMLCMCFFNNKNKMKANNDSTVTITLEMYVVIYNNFDQIY